MSEMRRALEGANAGLKAVGAAVDSHPAALCKTAAAAKGGLDDFEVGKPLGKGRFGSCYSAKRKSDNAEVVIKAMSKITMETAGMLEQCKREVANHRELRHPNIIAALGDFEDDARVYIVLEYAGAGSLYKRMQTHCKLAEEEASVRVAEIACALHYCHSHNIMHRDIKPENVLVASDGTTKLSDFGASYRLDTRMARRNTLCGTREYLAPEMVKGENYTCAVDVWSLGILAYELLFGHTPFVARDDTGAFDDEATFANICAASLSIPTSTDVSDSAVDFLRRLLVADPECRASIDSAIEHEWIRRYITMHESFLDRPSYVVRLENRARGFKDRLSTDSMRSIASDKDVSKPIEKRTSGGARRVTVVADDVGSFASAVGTIATGPAHATTSGDAMRKKTSDAKTVTAANKSIAAERASSSRARGIVVPATITENTEPTPAVKPSTSKGSRIYEPTASFKSKVAATPAPAAATLRTSSSQRWNR